MKDINSHHVHEYHFSYYYYDYSFIVFHLLKCQSYRIIHLTATES